MKLDGELGFCQQPTLVRKNDIVNDIVVKECCKRVVVDSKERDVVSVSLSEQMSRDRLWNVNEFDCTTSDDEDEGRDSEEPYNADDNAKSVIECELPELIVCYKDNVVKDICVDEGVTSLGQLLFAQSADGSEVASTIPTPDCLKPGAEKDESRTLTHQCAAMQIEESVDSAQHLVAEDLQPKLSLKDKNGANQLQSIQTSGEEAMPTLVPSKEEPNNVSNKTTQSDNLCSAIVDVTKEAESKISQKDGLIPDCDMVSNLVRQSPGEASFSVGESSFSAAGRLITSSEPIAYSGSCSLRSDSSTTSTRSFAFPVLQTEWNCSPVRMKAADRRKHRGWRQGFLCCRF